MSSMRSPIAPLCALLVLLGGASWFWAPPWAGASSHREAPLISRDPTVDNTDVYAFVANHAGAKSLVVALGVYPHQEPGIGPNKYNFDDNVLYEIHLARGSDSSTQILVPPN